MICSKENHFWFWSFPCFQNLQTAQQRLRAMLAQQTSNSLTQVPAFKAQNGTAHVTPAAMMVGPSGPAITTNAVVKSDIEWTGNGSQSRFLRSHYIKKNFVKTFYYDDYPFWSEEDWYIWEDLLPWEKRKKKTEKILIQKGEKITFWRRKSTFEDVFNMYYEKAVSVLNGKKWH